MLSFCITLHPHTHMRRLHSLALRVVLQARSLSAALRAGIGAEKRVATGLFAAGRVGWWGGGPRGVGWRAGCGVGCRVGWRAGWGGGQGGGGPGGVTVLAGRIGVCGYERLYSPKGCLYGRIKNALRNQVG